jgi:flagellin
MRIQHNIMAMNSYRNYNNNTSALSSNLEKLSSGYKINRAGDDAAGLAISEKMRAQITGLDQAADNVKDGISLVKTAEGALQEVQDMLNRMVELATQSANGTYDDSVDRANLQSEVDALTSEIDRISESSNFNGINLLDGSLGVTVKPTSIGVGGTYPAGGTAAEGSATVTTIDFSKLSNNPVDGATVTLTVGSKSVTYEFAKESGTVGEGHVAVKIGATLEETLTDLKTTINNSNKADQALVKELGVNAGTVLATDGAAYDKGVLTLTSAKPAKPGAEGGTTPAYSNFEVKVEGFGLSLQIGDTSDGYNQLAVGIGDMSSTGIGIDSIKIDEQGKAQEAINKIKSAINTVSSTRGDLGAIQNRLEHTSNNLSVMSENIQDAESTIRDTDIAEEMMAYTKNNILVQSAQAMLAQANQVPQGVLQLLQ